MRVQRGDSLTDVRIQPQSASHSGFGFAQVGRDPFKKFIFWLDETQVNQTGIGATDFKSGRTIREMGWASIQILHWYWKFAIVEKEELGILYTKAGLSLIPVFF